MERKPIIIIGADIVISAADGHSTIFDMLDGRYINNKIKRYYDESPIFPPLIQVSLGVAQDFAKEAHAVIYQLDKPITIAGEVRKCFSYRRYCFDPTLAPPGKSVLAISFISNYEYWKRLHENRERYTAEKQQIAETVMDQLEKRFPGIGKKAEMVDVATPMTWERYTGNWRGSYEGWLITTKTPFGMSMSETLPKLENFYMAGQWVEPGGGVPIAAMSGRNVIQIICKRDKSHL